MWSISSESDSPAGSTAWIGPMNSSMLNGTVGRGKWTASSSQAPGPGGSKRTSLRLVTVFTGDNPLQVEAATNTAVQEDLVQFPGAGRGRELTRWTAPGGSTGSTTPSPSGQRWRAC